MAFLQSIFFWVGLLAAAIPVVIHLLNRPRARVVAFSTLEFIRRLQIKRSKRIRIRELLLLLLRVLLLVLIGLAFARPALQGALAAGIGGRARTSACIVLDVSYSMGFREGEETLLDRAKDRARRIVDLLKEGDEAFLVLASEGAESRFETPTHNFRLLEAEIDRASLSSRGTDLARALEEAGRIIERSRNPNREIFLITDMQEAAFPAEGNRSVPRGDEPARVYLLPVGSEERPNLTIEGAELYEPRTLGGTVRIRATVANHSRESSEAIASLFLDGRPQGTAAVRVEPGRSEAVLFSVVLAESGVHRGEIRLAPDRLPRDDTFYFVLDRPEHLRVLLLARQEEPGRFFVRNALDPGGVGEGMIRVEEADPSALHSLALRPYHAVFLVGVPSIGEREAALLEEYAGGGGGIVIVPGDGIDFGNYNTVLLERLLPGVSIDPSVAEPRGAARIDRVQEDHPIFSIFRQGLGQALRDVVLLRHLGLRVGEGVSSVVGIGPDAPLLVEGKKGSGRVLFFAIGHDLEWSDLPAHAVYLPLLHETVRSLYSGGALHQTSLTVGRPFRKDLSGVALGNEFVCTTPLEEVALQPRGDGDRLVLRFDRTDAPGFYLIEGGGLSESFAVNLETAESNLAVLDPSEAGERLGLPSLRVIPEGRMPEKTVLESRYGRELWWEILGLVLLLAAVETAVARSHRPSSLDRG
ncbi:MAG: VWA domain-containing protein [Candidatus Eisenbacteria bacterium]|nr:VWA domain-containing protein [Candidatus Eisenbacteria bacterium]